MRVKLIRLLFMAILAMGTATACFDPVSQDVSISNIRHGKKFTTNLSVASMEYDVQTKSQYSGAEDLVQNWNLFIYDAEDDTRVGAYYRAADNQGTLSPMEFDVKLDHAYRYYAVANVGNVTSSAPAKDFIGGVSQMENFLLTNLGSAGDWNGVGIPSAWSGSQTFSSSTYRTNPAACVLNVQLTRLASRYSFRISHAQLNDWSLNITDFKVYGPTSAKPFSSAGYRETSTSQLPVTDYLLGVEKTFFNNASNDNAYTAAQAINKDFVFSSLNTGRPVCLYALENLCGTGSNTGGGADGWGKVPGNKPSSTNPSYVEITGTATLNDNSGASKSVTFRFYLGENEKNDYNVYRNKLYCITFTPTDESILRGHDGNWKIEPGPFSETRSLAFEHEGVRFRAGTSVVEGINKNPAALKYKVNIPSSLSANGNLVVKNGTTPVTSGSVIDAASLSLEAKDGIDAAGQLEIRTIEGLLYDILNVEIFNAYLQVLPDTPLTWDWNEHTARDITVTATVPWTASVPSGWTLSFAAGGAVSGEQPAGSNIALRITPPTADYDNITTNQSLNMLFAASGTDGDTVVLQRRYKPQVTSGDNTSASLAWDWNATASKTLTIAPNEDWVIVWPEGDHSHWTVTPTSGAKTATSITITPSGINDSVNAIENTFYVVPVRGGVNVEAGKLTVTITHGANVPHIEVSGSDLNEGALKWLWYQNGGKTFSVSANIPWEVVPNDAATASFNVSNPGTGVVNVTPKNYNYTASALPGTLTVRGTGSYSSVSQTVSLSQSRYPAISVEPASYTWAAGESDARSVAVTITVGEGESYQWCGSVSDDAGNTVAFSMTPVEGASGASFSAKPAGTNASETVENKATVNLTLKGDFGSANKPTATVSLKQQKLVVEPYLTPSATSLSWYWYEYNTQNVTISSNKIWGYSISGTDASHFSVTREGDVLRVSTTVNDNEERALEAQIDIVCSTNPELNRSITLSQTKCPALSVSPTSCDWNYNESGSGNPATITISGDAAWTASLSDATNWTISATSGAAPGSVTVYPNENNNDETTPKTCTVTFSYAGGKTRTVTLTQAKKTTFTVSPTGISWTGTDVSPQTITVTASGSWSVTAPTGYTIKNSGGTVQTTINGSGNGTFTVYPSSPNNTYSDLPAVQMQVTSGSSTINVTLQQLAKEKVYQEVYFEVSGTSYFSFHDANYYSAEIVGRYDGDQYDTIADVSDEVDWSYSGEFSPYVESATGNYRVQVYNTTTSSLTGKVSASFSGGEYAGHWVGATSDDQSVSVNAYPYVSASDVNIGWNNTSSHSYDNVSTNESLYEVSGFGSWFTSSSIYSWRASANNDSSPRSSVITVKVRAYDYIASGYVYESDTFTITQDGKPQSYTHTAAYIEIYLDDYSIDEGSTTKATAYLYTGEYTDSNPSASNDPDDYTWSSSDITSTVSGQFTSSKSSVASVSGRTVSGNSPGTAVIGTSYVPSGYDKVFDTNPASLTVNAATPVPEFSYWRYYDLEVSLNADPEDPNTIAAAGGTSQLSATATWKRVKVYTDGSEPEPYETGSCTSITDSRFSVTRTSGSTEFSYDESYGTVSVGSNTSTSTRSATFTATFTIGSGLGQASDSDDATVTQEGAVVTNTYTAAYTVVSVDDTDLKVNETTSVMATLYVGTYTGPATSAPTSFSSYDWDSGTAISAVSSNMNVFGKVSGNTWKGISAGTATVFASVNLGSYDMPFNDLCVTQTVTVSNPDVITYDNFTVTMSPESISKGESSYASATIQKYVNGNKDGNPIDVTSFTTFSTSSSFVTKKGTREFEWNGVGIMDYDVTIQGTLSNGTYGSHSGNATLTVEKEKYPILFDFDKDSYVVASDAAVTNTCNFSVKVTYSDGSYDYVGSGLIPWSDISINTYSNAFFAGDGEFMAVRANSSTEARLLYKGEPQVCTATLTSQNPYELIGINPDISSGEGELYIGFEAEYQYLCQDSAGNMQDNIRVSGIKPTVTPSKISGAGSMTCTWAKLSTSDKFFTISSVSTSKYLFEFYYSDAHGNASISYYVTKNGSSSSYDVDPGDN